MIIAISDLSQEALYGLVEAFVLREGTDYGELEFSLAQKVNHVIAQLKSGQAQIEYSELHESVSVIPTNKLR